MSDNADIVVIGSGPAGVSAAFPLVEAGRRVVMIDGADERDAEAGAPWQRMLGAHLESLTPDDGLSPKLRTPEARRLLGAFQRRERIDEEDFLAIGACPARSCASASGALRASWRNDPIDGTPGYPYAERSHFRRSTGCFR